MRPCLLRLIPNSRAAAATFPPLRSHAFNISALLKLMRDAITILRDKVIAERATLLEYPMRVLPGPLNNPLYRVLEVKRGHKTCGF